MLASYSRPHFPLTAPKRLFDKYWPDNVDMPNIPEGHLEQTHRYAKGLRDNFKTEEIPSEEARKARAAYYACCEFLDETVGDLLALLERDGLLDNTIIVYTTDHGEMAGEHGQWWKSSYYEAAARVPLIVWDRSLQQSRGTRVTAPVELNDLFPTLCARAEIPIPQDLDGSDLTNLMSGNAEGWRDTAITEYWSNQTTGPMRMLRTPRYKYVAFPEDESILFDLETDPDEFENLAGQAAYQDLEASLHEQLMSGFSWESVAEQKAADMERSRDFKEPWGRGTPNQYTLPDGRVVDAEICLYRPSVRKKADIARRSKALEHQSSERRVDTRSGVNSVNRTLRQKIRFPAILAGLLLVAAMCAVTPYNNYFLQNTKIAGNHLPAGSIFGVLLLVFLVNVPMRKLMRNGTFCLLRT